MYICICNKITDTDIRQELDNGACSLECLQKRLKVATCCGKCKDCAKRLVHEVIGENMPMTSQAVLSH